MNLRAVIFDVYCTLLEVGPPPADAAERWHQLFGEFLGGPPVLSRLEYASRCDRIIARLHTAARALGIRWPEILWPAVALEALPELGRLAPAEREEFLYRQMQVGRTLRLAPGVAGVLRWLQEHHRLLGLASNAQAYTLRELDTALAGAGLNLAIFEPALRFWSFEHGFSKPDPHVFRLLGIRLEALGIAPDETLMVGDRPDNDLDPARAFGWRTWQVVAARQDSQSGTWSDLLAWLENQP